MNQYYRLKYLVFFLISFIAYAFAYDPVYAVECSVKYNPVLHTNSYTTVSDHSHFSDTGNYYTTIENQDSSDCGMGYFSVSIDIPKGWNYSFDPTPPIAIKPGDTGSYKLFVYPPSSAQKATFDLPVHITNTTTGLSTDMKYWYIVTDDPAANTPTPTPVPTSTPLPIRRITVPTTKSPVHISPTVRPSPTATPTVTAPTETPYTTPSPSQTNATQHPSLFESIWIEITSIFSNLFSINIIPSTRQNLPKEKCGCWDGKNNICLPPSACF